MSRRPTKLGPDWNADVEPSIDDPRPWHVDRFAVGEAAGELHTALRGVVISAKHQYERLKVIEASRFPRDKFFDALFEAEKAIHSLVRMLEDDEIDYIEDYCNNSVEKFDEELLLELEEQLDARDVIIKSSFALAKLASSARKMPKTKGVHNRALKATALDMAMEISKLMPREAQADAALYKKVVEAAWRDAQFGPLGAFSAGPEFRDLLGKYLK